MPVDNHRDRSSEPSDAGEPNHSVQPTPVGRRRRFVTRRNAILSGIAIGLGVVVIIIVAFMAYKLGFVDRYIAGQVQDTFSKYGVRAQIKTFHTSFSPQTVEMLGLELFDAQTGDKLGKIDRLLATVRIEDLYALNLRRNINLKDLQIEGIELWVTFDAQGRSNFRNIHIPPPEPNQRILFAYSTAHVELKNSQIHYGDALHSLSGEARNLRATIQPDDPSAPAASWMNTVTFASTNSTFVYDGRPVNNIDIDARGRINQTRAEIQDITLRSPIAEAHLQGAMDDWRALKYNFNLTSNVDLTQASDILQAGMTLRGAAEKSYGTTITGLILRDARAEYRDGILTASAPQFNASSLTTSTMRIREGIQATDLRVKSEKGVTSASIASAKAGKIEAEKTTVSGVTAKAIDIKSNEGITNVTVKEVQLGEANAFGAKTGSINIAGVRLAIRERRVEGSTNDIDAGTVTLENGRVENVKLARPVFTVEPSGRYRASADLSLGGGVLAQMKLGPAHASLVASGDQIQVNNFVAEALEGRATGNATIALTKKGASHVGADFNNFDLGGLITIKVGADVRRPLLCQSNRRVAGRT